MKLPYGQAAKVEQVNKKLETYSLNTQHVEGDIVTSFNMHDIVALTEDIETQRFHADGDILLPRGLVGTIVEEYAQGEAFEVEFSGRDGQAFAMLAIEAEKLFLLHFELPKTEIEKLEQTQAGAQVAHSTQSSTADVRASQPVRQ